MKFKKFMSMLLGVGLTIGSIVPSYGATANISKFEKTIAPGKTYYYNIDDDKDKDKIQLKVINKYYLRLYINNKYVKQLTTKYNKKVEDCNGCNGKLVQTLKLCDFNKYDKTLDFVFSEGGNPCKYVRYNYLKTYRILKYKNTKCMVDKTANGYFDGLSWNDKTGEVQFYASAGSGGLYDIYSYFYKSLGYEINVFNCFADNLSTCVYVNKYKTSTSTAFRVTDDDRDIIFHSIYDLNLYNTLNDAINRKKGNAIPISKNQPFSILYLYEKNNKYYIKVKAYMDGEEGYVCGYIPVSKNKLFVHGKTSFYCNECGKLSCDDDYYCNENWERICYDCFWSYDD